MWVMDEGDAQTRTVAVVLDPPELTTYDRHMIIAAEQGQNYFNLKASGKFVTHLAT